MKIFSTLCMIGILGGAVLAVLLRDSNAADADPRIKHIEDASISGIKVPVPNAASTEVSLVTRSKELAEKERQLKEKEDLIAVEELRLKIRIDEFQKLHDEIAGLQQKNKKESAEILQRLVKTFQSMAPKKAAGVISAMRDDLAVDLFLTMKEKSVAAVLESMDPARAMALSSLVAERRPAGKATGEKQAQ